MSILATLGSALGPSLAKVILKTWLHDDPELDLAADLVSFLQKQAGSTVAGQAISQRIETLSKQMIKRMVPLFEQESGHLPEAERAAIAYEVAATLAHSEINAQLLIESKLAPATLAAYFKQANPQATTTFSAAASALYDHLITVLSEHIVSIATTLEGFATSAFAANLQSQEQILTMLTKLFEQPDAIAQRFEQTYRETLARQLDKLELFGLPRIDNLSKHQSLSVAYVTLHAERRGQTNSRSELDLVKAAFSEDPSDSSAFASAPGSANFGGPIDQLLGLSRRLVIRAEAGSGKSTLLQWIAVRAARQDFSECTPQLRSWDSAVPFFIRLREWVNKDFPAPEQFVSSVRQVAGGMPQGWVHRQLETGQALVLIDGVDELPGDQRRAMLDQLSQLVAAYPLARYIVTSRPAAVKAADWPEWDDWTTREQFLDATLQPLTPGHVNMLIDQWHKALAAAVTDADERAELAELPSSLKRLLQQRPPLRRLATSPLLCAMLCALHRERRQQLPAERIKLYEECIEMLLSRRDEGRKVQLERDYPNLGHAQKLAIMQDFAYWMMQNVYSDVEVIEADNHIAHRLTFMSLPPNATPAKVRSLFVDRASLLCEPVEGHIDFAHRTFQEFLAAQAAAKEGNIGALLTRALDDQWREVIILTAGLVNAQQSEKLLRGLTTKRKQLLDSLLRREDRYLQDNKRLCLLAAACLETCVELSPEVRQLVIDQAASFLPPRDKDDAKLIAAAGDPIVPLLQAKPGQSNRQAVLCIETLALIGSDTAMQAIATYTRDHHDSQEILQAIANAWAVFDRRLFAQTVLSNVERLYLNWVPEPEDFRCVSHIEFLVWYPDTDVEDISSLRSLPNLKSLFLTSGWMIQNSIIVKDLSLVSELSQLTTLDLSNTQVSNLQALTQLSQLTTLHLNRTQVSKLQPLAQLSLLTTLDIANTNVSDLQPLAQLLQLTKLSLTNTEVSNLQPLAQLSQLSELDISNTEVSDLRPLASLSQLTTLYLDYTQVSDLQPLAELWQLTILSLDNTKATDLRPLSKLSHLTTLSLEYTQVTDLRPLKNLLNLQYLHLNWKHNLDLSPLRHLKALQIRSKRVM